MSKEPSQHTKQDKCSPGFIGKESPKSIASQGMQGEHLETPACEGVAFALSECSFVTSMSHTVPHSMLLYNGYFIQNDFKCFLP